MKALLAVSLLVGPIGFFPALAHSADQVPVTVGTNVSTVAGADAAVGSGAFTLTIEAPAEVKELLERNLDVLRYRELADLSDSELARLMLAADKDARDLLATQGYFSPKLALEPPVSPAGTVSRSLTLRVEPGEPTEVTTVKLNFAGAIESDPNAKSQRALVEQNWLLRPGMRFSQTRWTDAKQQALLKLTAQNYPTARLSDSHADIDPLTGQAKLEVTLDSGPRYRLGALVVSGLNHFDQDMVRRLVQIEPGDYDQAKLVAAQQRLTDSGYFDSAFISIDAAGDPAAAPVLVQVREAKLQKLVLGVGLSTDSGARLSMEHSHNKVPILDWRSVNKLLVTRDSASLASEFTSHPNDDNWRWVVGTEFKNEELGSFAVHSQGLALGRRQTTERLDKEYYLQYVRAEAATSDQLAQAVVQAFSATYAFTLRRFDHPLFPNEGWGFGLAVEGGTTLGSQTNPYGKAHGRGLRFFSLGKSDPTAGISNPAGRIAARAEWGAIVAKEGGDLPSTELFFAGGDNSVRGYEHNSLGVPLPDGKITGGRYLALGSVEWQRPIYSSGRATDWESTVFVDAGAVANTASELRPRFGLGVGARWKSPVGPLQIDLAYGVDVRRLRLHLNVGFKF